MPNKMHLAIVGRKYDYAYGFAACGALTYRWEETEGVDDPGHPITCGNCKRTKLYREADARLRRE